MKFIKSVKENVANKKVKIKPSMIAETMDEDLSLGI